MPAGQRSPTAPQGKFLWRALVVWLVFITIESMLGTLRVLFLEPHVGAARAQRIGLITGSAALLIVAYLLIGWLRAESRATLLAVGVLWVVLTFSFELALRRLRGRTWQSLIADYDITRGGLMSFALVLLLFAPWIAASIRNRKSAAISPSS